MLFGGCHNAFMASQVLESDCYFQFVKNNSNFSTSNNLVPVLWHVWYGWYDFGYCWLFDTRLK